MPAQVSVVADTSRIDTKSFRTLPEYEFEFMPPRIRLLLRKAMALQANLNELHDGVKHVRSLQCSGPAGQMTVFRRTPLISARRMGPPVR